MGKDTSKHSAVFLDRDGTLIHEKNYLKRVKDIKLFSFTIPALKKLILAGYKLMIITNQSGIGRGYFTLNKLNQINNHLKEILLKKGVKIDAIYFCPHLPDDNCDCRKPNLGLVKQAAKDFNIDLLSSYSIGDHIGDYLLGQRMGGKGVLLLTGHGKKEMAKIKDMKIPMPDKIVKNIYQAVNWILSDSHIKLRNKK